MRRVNTANYPKAVNAVFGAFSGESAIRLVGGCVRDLVLGITPKDWDMTTPAPPNTVIEILEKSGYQPFDLSNGHGTISVIIDDETVEITTLRIDVETDGRHAIVAWTEDWSEDAARRDFTINAMSADEDGVIYDYFRGLADLDEQILRFVGDANQRIQEDYLRILRFFRFRQRFNLMVDTDTLLVIEDNAAGLKQISGERIWAEMQKILSSAHVQETLQLMSNYRVLENIGLTLR